MMHSEGAEAGQSQDPAFAEQRDKATEASFVFSRVNRCAERVLTADAVLKLWKAARREPEPGIGPERPEGEELVGNPTRSIQWIDSREAASSEHRPSQ